METGSEYNLLKMVKKKKNLAKNHLASTWQSKDLSSSVSDSEDHIVFCLPCWFPSRTVKSYSYDEDV